MNNELLQKYISGDVTEAEKQRIVQWIEESPENMREYMAQRKLYDIALWRTEPAMEVKRQEKRKFTLRSVGMELIKMAAVFALALAGGYYMMEMRPDKPEPLQSLYVPAGQRAELMLADGTKVWLNSRSSLTFPGSFDGDTRQVKLDGEGYFDVAKNAECPFIVETNQYNVRVLGTEFNVKAYAVDSVWETSLLKGAVEILRPDAEGNGLRLEPNTMARLEGDHLVKGRIKNLNHFLWREGLICFNNITVGEMFKKLELYFGVNIEVKNDRILKNRYTGKFRTSDGVEHVLKVLRLRNEFTYTKDDETNVITIN